MTPISSTRLHGLDAIRGMALLLGIVFHAAFSFFPGDQFWLIMDAHRSGALSGLAFVLHIFRMTLFFLLAGYFARLQTNRLGAGEFSRDRLKRIGGPLVIFWLPMMIAFIALAIWGMVVANGGTMPENPPPAPPLTLQTFPLTHLWFLYSLLLLYAGALVLRWVLIRLKLDGVLGRVSDHALTALAPIGLLPVLLAVPTALVFAQQSGWHPFFGIPTPEYGFVPNSIATIAYGTAFGIGWLLQRSPEHLRGAARLWPLFLILAAGLSAYCLSRIGLTVSYMPTLTEEGRPLYAVAYSLAIWMWTFGLIGLGLRIWSKESKARRYVADASYWLYLIHLPIVMALQVWMSQWALAAELKFILILALSIPPMLLSYHMLVRFTFLGSLLNGRRRERAKRVQTEVMA